MGSSALAKNKPPGANIDLTAIFKKEVGCPVIVVGKFAQGSNAVNHAVEEKQIEMVAIGLN